jgi:hypothetical protein
MKTFTEWTVLPHDPIEKLAPNLWRVSGTLGTIQRQMTLAKLRDGRVCVINPVALDKAAMTELEAWGDPAIIAIPNGYHRQDAAIWKARYPKATLVAPPRGRKRVAKVVAVDAVTTDVKPDADVRFVAMDGCDSDTLVEVKSGDDVTLVFCDVILNLPKVGGIMGFVLAPTGTVSTPRIQRWLLMRDKRAFSAHMRRLADTPNLKRVLVGHGTPITDDAPGALRQVAEQLA